MRRVSLQLDTRMVVGSKVPLVEKRTSCHTLLVEGEAAGPKFRPLMVSW